MQDDTNFCSRGPLVAVIVDSMLSLCAPYLRTWNIDSNARYRISRAI